MFYVVKVTIEDGQQTQEIRPHTDERASIVDFHGVFANTIVYDTVVVCLCMRIDDYGNQLDRARYERPSEEPDVPNVGL